MTLHRVFSPVFLFTLIGILLTQAAFTFADELSPIVVTATRLPVTAEDTLSDFVIITHDEILQAGHSSLTEVLQAQRGVQIDSYGGSGNLSSVHLRGSSNAQVLMLLDGVRIESSNHGGPILNQIPLGLIDHIEIVFGSQSTLYGANALGGVIQIFTKRIGETPNYSIQSGYGSQGSSQTSFDSSGEVDGYSTLSYKLGITHERSTGFNTIATNNLSLPFGYPTRATGFNRIGIIAEVISEWQTNHQIGFKVFSSSDAYQYPGSDSADSFNGGLNSGRINEGIYKFTSVSFFSKDKLGDDWLSELHMTKSYQFTQNNSPATGLSPSSNDSNTMPDSDVTWQHTIQLDKDIFQLILENRVQAISTQYSFDQSGCTTPASCSFYKSRTSNSLASSYSMDRGNHLLLLSLREDEITDFDTRTNGGIAYGYKFGEGWKVVGDLNTGYRVPTYGDLYYPVGSNPKLTPESSRNSELGVTYLNSLYSGRLFLFQNIVHNFIEPASNSFVALEAKPINIGSVRMKGVSSGFDFKYQKISVKIGLDYIQATDENTGLLLPRVAKFASNFRLDFREKGLDLGVVMTSTGATYDDIKDSPSTINAPFVLFNLYGSYKFDKNWSVFTRLNNILNTQYQTAYGYAMPGFNGFGGVRYTFE